MPALFSLLLAFVGIGAAAGGGGGGGSSAPAAPTTSRTPLIPEEPDEPETPEEDDEPPVAAADSPPPPPPAPESPAVEDEGSPTSGAPDLPDSAYALGWEGLTAEEQYMLELVNRARLDPEAEEIRTGQPVDVELSTAPKQALAVDPIRSAQFVTILSC